MIHLESIRHTYGIQPAGTVSLDGVTLEIAEGKVSALVGPSGCGKTTLLRMIGGLLQPSEGTITWREPGAQPSAKERVGFVFQKPALCLGFLQKGIYACHKRWAGMPYVEILPN